MIGFRNRQKITIATSLAAVMMLTACAGINERVAAIGKPPVMTEIKNPYSEEGYKPVALPMPPQAAMNTQANSLWQSSRQTFFKDQRANKVGDILTVMIDISDEADMKNKTERKRSGNDEVGVDKFLGLEKMVGKVMPDAFDNENMIGMESTSNSTGDGKIKREEDIKMKLAAMITQVLPNGNFVIRGKQEVRVNFELRELTLDGVIRPEDVLNNNSISYEKIAEARISYGGRGQVTDIQQPRYGQQLYDAVFPF